MKNIAKKQNADVAEMTSLNEYHFPLRSEYNDSKTTFFSRLLTLWIGTFFCACIYASSQYNMSLVFAFGFLMIVPPLLAGGYVTEKLDDEWLNMVKVYELDTLICYAQSPEIEHLTSKLLIKWLNQHHKGWSLREVAMRRQGKDTVYE